jgi:hypothetical protein
MLRLVMDGMMAALRRRCRPLCVWAMRGFCRLRLLIGDQRLQIRFEALTVFRGMPQQQLDQAALPGAEMPMNPASRQAVQKANRLLDQKPFELFSGHCRTQSFVFSQ